MGFEIFQHFFIGQSDQPAVIVVFNGLDCSSYFHPEHARDLAQFCLAFGKRIVIAAGEGAKAALAVKQYLMRAKNILHAKEAIRS